MLENKEISIIYPKNLENFYVARFSEYALLYINLNLSNSSGFNPTLLGTT